MLKSLHIGRYVSDPKDLRVLAEFLQAIGFESVAADGKAAMLSAPLALLSLNSLAKEYPAEVRERLKDVNRLLVIEVTNPDVVFEIAQQRKFKLLADAANPKTHERSFSLELPGEIVLSIHGRPEEAAAALEGQLNAAGKRFAIVVSRFNSFITERLLQGALDGLRRTGAENERIAVIRVPGSFEIPSAARTLAETGKYDAVICVGCLSARRHGALRRDCERSNSGDWAVGAGDRSASCVCRADLRDAGAGDRSCRAEDGQQGIRSGTGGGGDGESEESCQLSAVSCQ